MKKKASLVIFLFLAIFIVFQTSAQFTPEELAERTKWEEFLKKAEIIRSEDVPEGVTKPIRLYLRKGDAETSGCWKNIKGKKGGYLEGWEYEWQLKCMSLILFSNFLGNDPKYKKEGD